MAREDGSGNGDEGEEDEVDEGGGAVPSTFDLSPTSLSCLGLMSSKTKNNLRYRCGCGF